MKKTALVIIAIFLALTGLPGTKASQPIKLPVSQGPFSLGQSSCYSIPLETAINPQQMVNFRGKLLYEGMELTCDEGMPQIPFISKRILLPKGYAGKGIRISKADFVKLPLPYLEAYTPKVWGKPDFSVPNIANPRGAYPERIGDFKFESGIGGNYANIMAFPVVCDFDGKSLYVARSFELQIEAEPVENAAFASEDEEDAKNNALILTSSTLRIQADKLAKSQRDSGYKVEVVEVESLKGRFEPQKEEPEFKGPKNFSKKDKEYFANYDYDFARTIRSYILSRKGQAGYITILGDATHVPPSFYYIANSYMLVDRFVPSDIFYSSPDLDLVPDFALGRIPVRNVSEAETMVSKINDYKKSLSPDWFHSIQLGGGDPFSGGFEGELECQSLIDDGLLDNFKVTKRYKTSDRFDTASMLEAFRKDSGFIYVVSHGSGDAIVTEPGKVTTDDVMALPRKSRLPILVSVACLNGMYDTDLVGYKLENYPNSKGMSFAQACMASPGGPVAYFGGTRLNYAGINWTIESGVIRAQPFSEIDRCMKEVMNAYHNWSSTLGEMMVTAFTKYTGTEKGWFSSYKTTFCFAFFGDPTIKLPATPEGTPHRMPEVEFKNCPMTKGRISIPILSCIDSNTINLRSDLAATGLRVMDLEDDAKTIENSAFKPNGEKAFTTQFRLATKKVWHGRIDLPNGSEVWFYCLSSVNNDVSLRNNTSFFTRKPGEKLRFSLDALNEGTRIAKSIEVDFIVDGKKIETRRIKQLEVNEYRTVSFVQEAMPPGNHKVRFEVRSEEKDQYNSDNAFEKDLLITDSDTSKTGILVSYLFSRSKADKVFNIDSFNAKVKTLGNAPTEIAKIGSDSYWDMLFGAKYENFKNLGCDSVIIASQDFGNPFSGSLVKALADFSASGGTIIGMGCLGSSTSAPVYSSLAEIFGFSSQDDYETDNVKEAVINVLDPGHPLFAGLPQGQLRLSAISATRPKGGKWDSYNRTGTKLAGSEDGLGIVTSNTRNLYFSMLPKFADELHLKLLYNVSTYNLRPQPDATLTLSELSCQPTRISVGEEGQFLVTVKNNGNTVLGNVVVEVGQLNESQTIKSIGRGSQETVSFKMPAQAKTGILELSASAMTPNDINPDDNNATLKVRVYETKSGGSQLDVTDLNVRNGDLLPWKDFQLSGKTQPGALVTVNGRLTRADSKGRFALLAKPGNSPLVVSVKSLDGSESSHRIWCAFSQMHSIGGKIGAKSMMTEEKFIDKTDYIPVSVLQGTNYVNITKASPHLGIEVTASGQDFKMKAGSFEVSGKIGDDKATLAIGEFSRETQLGKPVMDKDGSVLMPFSAMLELGFGGDIHVESQSYLLSFPADRISDGFKPYATENITQKDGARFPSETDYGKPSLISTGPVDEEVARVVNYFIGKENRLYLWTTRGIEEWTKDGKFIDCMGLPQTASKDFKVSWNYLFHPEADEYEHGSSSFLVLPDGGLVLRYSSTVAFYDKSWKLLATESFPEIGLNLSVSLQINQDGEIVFADNDGILHRYSAQGRKLGEMTFFDSENSAIVSVTSLQVMPQGNILMFERPSFWFASPDWALRLYDKTGKILKERIVKYEEGSEEKYIMSPTFVIGDIDGTFWFITDDFMGVSIEHYNSDFGKLEKVKIGEGGMIARGGMGDFRIDENGVFWTKGRMTLGEDTKQSLLAKCARDFKLKGVITRCSSGGNRFMTPYDLNFDRDGNLIVYTDDYMERYSQLGNRIDNLSFTIGEEEHSIDYCWQIKHEGEFTTGIVESRTSFVIMVADKENKVVRLIPAITEEPMRIGDYATDFAKGEIYITDSLSSIPVKVIPTYMENEKDPDQVEILRQFGVRGFGRGKMADASAVQRIGDRLYILDRIQSKILAFTTAGEFLFEFGGAGSAPGKIMNPYAMSVDSKGLIWILDSANSRIAVFDGEGTFVTQLGKEGIYTTPGSLDEYADTAFTFLEPMHMAVRDGQIAIFEYTHERLMILSQASDTTNLTVYPEKPSFNGFVTDKKLTTWFTVTNTGIGNLEATFKCEDENVAIEGGSVGNNAGLVKVTLDISKGLAPKSVKIDIASSIGEGHLLLPVELKPVGFAFSPGSMIAMGSNGLVRLTRIPVKTDAGYIFSTKDFPQLVPLSGLVAKDDSTVYYSHGDRKLGFEAGRTYATLQVGLDTFKVDLGMKVEKSRNGGLIVPIDVAVAFLSCQMVVEGNLIRVVERK